MSGQQRFGGHDGLVRKIHGYALISGAKIGSDVEPTSIDVPIVNQIADIENGIGGGINSVRDKSNINQADISAVIHDASQITGEIARGQKAIDSAISASVRIIGQIDSNDAQINNPHIDNQITNLDISAKITGVPFTGRVVYDPCVDGKISIEITFSKPVIASINAIQIGIGDASEIGRLSDKDDIKNVKIVPEAAAIAAIRDANVAAKNEITAKPVVVEQDSIVVPSTDGPPRCPLEPSAVVGKSPRRDIVSRGRESADVAANVIAAEDIEDDIQTPIATY